jgi:hypothetical protein
MVSAPRPEYYHSMTNKIFLSAKTAGLLVGMTFLATLTGCMVEGGPRGHVQTTVVFQDDYDYYPGYETYYSRNRREFVYLEGNAWVRRPEPRGVSVSVLLAAPSVRLDFHDAPEQHHRTVIQSYPRTWNGPSVNHNAGQVRPEVKTEHREVQQAQPATKKTNAKKDRQDDKDDKKDDRKDDDKGPDRPGKGR